MRGDTFGADASRVWVTRHRSLPRGIRPRQPPETTTPRRHRASRAHRPAPSSLLLCKYDSAAPPIRGRPGAVTWREASFLCAPLFPSLAAILFSPRVGLRRIRRAQVRPSPRPSAPLCRHGPLFPCCLLAWGGWGVAVARRRSVPVRRAGPWWGRGRRSFPEERTRERGRAPGRGVLGSALARVAGDSPVGPRCPGRAGLP